MPSEQRSTPPTDAQCALHLDQPAQATCGRCGAFACGVCWVPELDLCAGCRALGDAKNRRARAAVKRLAVLLGMTAAANVLASGRQLFLVWMDRYELHSDLFYWGGPLTVLALLLHGGLLLGGLVVLLGAVQMYRLRTWTFALLSAALAMVPCGTGVACVVGFPIGAWAVWLLTGRDYRSCFRRQGAPHQ